ncbi:hypothetical protein BpHYR1_031673 [Brachionus plicatilis]|uniref:Uncharacterized protein n=1 Tax=Brachionus plicatilis TaxID=10195 RepID=A0A3M7RJL5_BRAPC|nr:hypothetical protein BpHYR1_031673 [Brachionus plicatilis]
MPITAVHLRILNLNFSCSNSFSKSIDINFDVVNSIAGLGLPRFYYTGITFVVSVRPSVRPLTGQNGGRKHAKELKICEHNLLILRRVLAKFQTDTPLPFQILAYLRLKTSIYVQKNHSISNLIN